jgi:hypothetical protein
MHKLISQIRNRIHRALPILGLSVVLTGFTTGGAVVLNATPAAAITYPTVTYQMYDSTCAAGGPCRERVTIDSNPNNAAVRAYISCGLQFVTLYGSWHTSVGAQSNTPSCDGYGEATYAGFEFNKTQRYSVNCWNRGNSWNGFC